jgi:misacylated tRNA(Ala) deacylase
MTDLLYHSDSYLREFEAMVLKIDRELNAVILDRTAFYPGGGGQVPDAGIIRFNETTVNLIRAKQSPDGILHILESNQSLPKEGAIVSGVIDWERRYKVMRTHTAMHILCGVIFRDFGAHVTGGAWNPSRDAWILNLNQCPANWLG